MTGLYDLAFARLERAEQKRVEFGEAWAEYIAPHPWTGRTRQLSAQEFELFVVSTEDPPPEMALIFSEWLSNLRAALDNALFAWAVSLSGQNPPPDAALLQFPIFATETDFRRAIKRLKSLPDWVVGQLEKSQPYHSPYGPESNLLYWLNELSRVDRHRSLHVSLGRVAEHKIRLGLPRGITAVFDESVRPLHFIDGELLVARFSTSGRIRADELDIQPDIGIDPEILAWGDFEMNGSRPNLRMRMGMTELFTRNHLENMAHMSGVIPKAGIQTFDPNQEPISG